VDDAERPTCLLCLTTKADVPMPLVVRAVDRIGKITTIHIANNGRCGACGSALRPDLFAEASAVADRPSPARVSEPRLTAARGTARTNAASTMQSRHIGRSRMSAVTIAAVTGVTLSN
jgi:hypothetical protein